MLFAAFKQRIPCLKGHGVGWLEPILAPSVPIGSAMDLLGGIG